MGRIIDFDLKIKKTPFRLSACGVNPQADAKRGNIFINGHLRP
jgi:hypothetical protein